MKSERATRSLRMAKGRITAYDHIGRPRVESIMTTLQAFNSHIEVEAIPENIDAGNVADLVGRADIVFGAARG